MLLLFYSSKSIFIGFYLFSFSVTGAHACAVLIYFIYPFAWVWAHGCVVDTAGHGGDSILKGLGCWPTIGLLWAPDLHLR